MSFNSASNHFNIVDFITEFGVHSINLRDSYTAMHCHRVAILASTLISDHLGNLKENNTAHYTKLTTTNPPYFEKLKKTLSDDDFLYGFPVLEFASRVHDLGKIGWDDETLIGIQKGDKDKPSSIDESKKRMHPIIGAKLLYKFFYKYNKITLGAKSGENKTSNNYRDVVTLVLFHHWGFNSEKSYPIKDEYERCKNLKNLLSTDTSFLHPPPTTGEDDNVLRLFIGAIKIADVFDALTTHRNYRKDLRCNEKSTIFFDDTNYNDIIFWLEKIVPCSLAIMEDEGMYHPQLLKILQNLSTDKTWLKSYFDLKNSPEQLIQKYLKYSLQKDDYCAISCLAPNECKKA